MSTLKSNVDDIEQSLDSIVDRQTTKEQTPHIEDARKLLKKKRSKKSKNQKKLLRKWTRSISW
jgi:soluble cytochrome b562